MAADPPAGCTSRCAPPPWNTARTSGLLTPGNGPGRPSWTKGQRSVPCARSLGTRRSGHRTLPAMGACPGTFLSLPEWGCNPPPERSGYHRARGSDAGPVDGASWQTIPSRGRPSTRPSHRGAQHGTTGAWPTTAGRWAKNPTVAREDPARTRSVRSASWDGGDTGCDVRVLPGPHAPDRRPSGVRETRGSVGSPADTTPMEGAPLKSTRVDPRRRRRDVR